MSRKSAIGVSLLYPADPMGIERGVWAAEQGFESIWVPDGNGKGHALTVAAVVAARTEKVRVCTGIVPVYTHTPAVLAASVSALEHTAPGRIVLGLGASTQGMMENWNGIPYEKPLARVRETVQVLRRMLAGEKVEFSGETLHTRGFRLNPPPARVPPIYLAALRPRMLELAGEVADGVILHLAPVDAMPRILAALARGAERAGRNVADIEVVLRYNVVTHDDVDAARNQFRKAMFPYFYAPAYNKFLAWCGHEAEAGEFSAGFAAGDRARTERAFSDHLVDTLGAVGSADRCRAAMAPYLEAGVHTMVINPVNPTQEEAERSLLTFAPGTGV